jgi:heme-degrading monooxygenase HmoA
MSVLMTLWVQADPAKLEQYAADHQDKMREIADRAKAGGCLSHAFYGSEDGQVLVVDEWDSPESFQSFFESDQDIPQMMQEIGVTSEPRTNFFRKLETHDEF